MRISEILHEPEHPYDDGIAVKSLNDCFRRCRKAGLVRLGRLDDYEVLSSGHLDDPEMIEIFLVRDGKPCGELTLSDPRGNFEERRVASTYVTRECRGIGYRLYRFALDHGVVLLSGRTQTDDGRRMWTKLARDPAVDVRMNYSKPVTTDEDVALAYKSMIYFLTAQKA